MICLFKCLKKRKHKRIKLTASVGGFSFTGYKMATTLNTLQKFTLTATEQDASGAPVPFGSVPVWTSSNEAVATVLAAADGITAVVSSVAIGAATITVTADGLSASDDVTVIAAPGVTIVLTASAPEPK